MKELAAGGDRRMTVREVAEVLGCSPDTIYNSARELFPDIFRPGKTAYLTQEQVTAVKMNLRKNSEVAAQPKTDIEKALLIQQAMQYQQEIIDSLQEKVAAGRPKVEFFDQVADSADALQMRDVAGVLNIQGLGRNSLFKLLREKSVLDGRNIPYREYQDRGYFRVIEQKWTDKYGETRISLKTLVYQRGVDFIRKLAKEAV